MSDELFTLKQLVPRDREASSLNDQTSAWHWPADFLNQTSMVGHSQRPAPGQHCPKHNAPARQERRDCQLVSIGSHAGTTIALAHNRIKAMRLHILAKPPSSSPKRQVEQ